MEGVYQQGVGKIKNVCPDLCSIGEVKVLLKTTNPRKSSGPDNVPNWVLKDCVEDLAPVVCHLFNTSYAEGTVPTLWKSANVVPVPKAAGASQVEDFRPVSLLAVLAKLLERCVPKRLLPALTTVIRDQQRRAVTHGKFSTWHTLTSGVPQGGVLSPYLFLLFMSTRSPVYSCTLNVCYADDVSLSRSLHVAVANSDRAVEEEATQLDITTESTPDHLTGGRREVPPLPTLKERREVAAVKLLLSKKNMLENGHWEDLKKWNCTYSTSSPKTDDYLVLEGRKKVSPQQVAEKAVEYKYAVVKSKANRRKNVQWEFIHLWGSPGITNRCMRIPKDRAKPGGVWHQYNDFMLPKESTGRSFLNWVKDAIGFDRHELIEARTEAVKVWLPKWHGLYGGDDARHDGNASDALSQIDDVTHEEKEVLLEALSVTVDTEKMTCHGLNEVFTTFRPGYIRDLSIAIQSLIESVFKHPNPTPKWLLAIPIYHFLRRDSQPFHQTNEEAKVALRAMEQVIAQCSESSSATMKFQTAKDYGRTARGMCSVCEYCLDVIVQESKDLSCRCLVTTAVSMVSTGIQLAKTVLMSKDQESEESDVLPDATRKEAMDRIAKCYESTLEAAHTWLKKLLVKPIACEKWRQDHMYESAPSYREEPEVWSQLADITFGEEEINANWRQSLTDKLGARIKQVSSVYRAELFCQLDLEKMNSMIAECFTNAAFAAVESLCQTRQEGVFLDRITASSPAAANQC
ncbi:hypothetical protein Bbelb_317020 [Branchiostoma belcheri]|nr:hypothetical protein Bbelb_317020 [Branchiostoma belcheri]